MQKIKVAPGNLNIILSVVLQSFNAFALKDKKILEFINEMWPNLIAICYTVE